MEKDFWMDYRSPGLMVEHHKHQQFEVNYIVQGSASYLYTGYQIEMKVGGFYLMWAGLPHQLVHASEDLVMVWIYLPLEVFLNSGYSSAFVGNLLEGKIFHDTLNTDSIQMVRWYEEYKSQLVSSDVLLKEIELRIKRLQLNNKSVRPLKKVFAKKSLQKISIVCRYISDHFDQDLNVEILAKQVNLHPNYLMNLFKNETGYSINHYITRLRVAKAQTLLATTNDKVTTILYQCGFQSSSRFYKAFFEIAGMTPRKFKSQSQK